MKTVTLEQFIELVSQWMKRKNGTKEHVREIGARKENVQTKQNAKMCDLQIALTRKKNECERLRAELNRQRRIQYEIDAERCVWQERYRALSLQMREIITKTEGRIVQAAIADIKNERG